jgi:hypothetical protein
MELDDEERELSALQPIGSSVKQNFNFLKRLCRSTSDRQRWRLLSSASKEQLLAIVEICSNILSNDFLLLESQRSKIIPHADLIRAVSRKRTERSARKVLRQHGTGAFFGALLAPIIAETFRYFLTK